MMPPATYRKSITVSDEVLAAKCARGRVVIIDDDPEILTALAALMDLDGYACETYASGLAYLQVLNENRAYFAGPSCLLCDVKMPELDGLELQRRLREQVETPLLLMSGTSGAQEAVSGFRAGALDFLIKPMDADFLLMAVAKALTTSTLRQRQRTLAAGLASRMTTLTVRERQIARCVAQGQTNPTIAAELGIGLRTVKLHRQHAMEKVGASTTADLVRIADAGGL